MRLTEQLFFNLIQNSPVATLVLSGPESRIMIANQAFAALILRKPEELLNKSLYEILPHREAEFKPIIDKVRETATVTEINEHVFHSQHLGLERSGVLHLTFQPYQEADGRVSGVVVLCRDVTEQVAARNVLQHTLEQVRLSKEAAQLGLFDFDLVKNTLEWDNRCRTLFGISHQNPVSYDVDFVTGLHPDDRDRILDIIDRLFDPTISDGNYDVEYRTVGMEDQRLRWVRAKGKVYFVDDKPIRFIGSVLDITEQKELELRKNDFIGMVSHELKTPLTSLSGYLQSLLKKTEQDGQTFLHSFLTKAFTQTRKMGQMINGFLNLSRLESGKLQLDISTFDLGGLVRETAEELVMSLPQLRYRLELCDGITVTADRDKIASVIVNLISNAVKYAERGSEVFVSCSVNPTGEAVVSVTDNGVGIPEADLPFVFERFYRVERNRLKHVSGFGLGLYLSAEIMRYHAGRIWAESQVNQGSTFHFSLPAIG